jgi:hypothetical protein
MKKIFLVISIIAILAIVCSPVLAISKADLIASYGQSAPTVTPPSKLPFLNVITDDRSQWWQPTKPMPTPTPTPITTSDELTIWVNSTPSQAWVFIDGSCRGLTPKYIGISAGTHHLRVSRAGYEDYSTEILIPEPSPPRCYVTSYGMHYCGIELPIPIDVTLKKAESTLKPTITTIIPSPTPTPAPEPTPRVISDEEWKEITDRYSRAFA